MGIEAGIPRLVVAFVEDNGIFALGYFQIGIRFCQTQCPGGGSFGRPVFGQGIGMYGDEQISFGVIGNFSAPVQGDEYVPVPRIDNFYIRAVLLDLFAKFECYIQVDILLFGNFSHCTRVVSTVSGVYNDNKVFRFSAATAKGGDKQP